MEGTRKHSGVEMFDSEYSVAALDSVAQGVRCVHLNRQPSSLMPPRGYNDLIHID